MIGKPKFKRDDKVKFNISYKDKNYILFGTIYIIDAYGTFEQNEEVSYDIMVEEGDFPTEFPCLFKHVRESKVEKA